MALGEAGLWATRINDDNDLVLVVKAPTDTIKWIQRGATVQLVIAHVKVGGKTVRCVALQVSDSIEDPLLLGGPQNLTEDHAPFDGLLGKRSFTAYFHNESPFVSILDGVVTLDQSGIACYMTAHRGDQLYGDDTDFNLFRSAQDQFEHWVLNRALVHACPFQIHRIPVRIERMVWNSLSIPDSGTFDPANLNEGGSQEDLLVHLLKPHFKGLVVRSPQIHDGRTMRELCDVLALSDSHLFAIESKAFAVFEKPMQQSPDRRAKTILGHFEKAIGQLEGAMRRIEQGIVISYDNEDSKAIKLNHFKAAHAIVLVTTSNWELPWDRIGAKLRKVSNSSINYHFMTAMEFQRFVAYCNGDANQLHLLLARRSEVVCGSGNANIRTDLLPAPPSRLILPEIPEANRALAFAFDLNHISDNSSAITPILNLIIDGILALRRFSGRVEVRFEGGNFNGKRVLWLAICAGGTLERPLDGDKDWWFSLLRELRSGCERNQWPVPLTRSGRIRRTSALRDLFPDLLVAVEFQEGRVIGRVYGA